MRHRTGHVGNAVEHRPVHVERRVCVRRGPRILEAATLIDGDVDEHAAGLHPRDEVIAHEFGGLGTRHEDSPDHEIGVEAGFLDLVGVGGNGLHVALVDGVHLSQPGDVLVEEEHLGLHAERNGSGVRARDAGADDHDLRGIDPGDSTHEHPAAPVGSLQCVGTHLRRHATGDFRHRCKERE